MNNIPLEDFRTVSAKLLHYASLGYSRYAFHKLISKILLDHSKCDSVAILVEDKGQLYLSRIILKPKKIFEFRLIASNADPHRKTGDTDEHHNIWKYLFAELQDDQKNGIFGKHSGKHIWVNNVEALIRSKDDTENPDPLVSWADENKYKTVLGIPFVVSDLDRGALILLSNNAYFFTESDIALYENIAQNVGIAISIRRIQVEYYERVKELTCLYRIAQLVRQSELSMDDLLKGITDLLPPAWQYPEIASGRIVLDDREYRSNPHRKGKDRMKANILIQEKTRGFIEVTYSKHMPYIFEGPFLFEERKLIDTLAAEVATIIENREVEEQQDFLQNQLRHANRLATIGQLAAGVAHELNEPIGAILGFSQLSIKNTEIPDQVKEDLTKIINASLHAREVVRKLLTFARQVPTVSSELDLNDLIANGLYFLESRMVKEQIKLVHVLDTNLPVISADKSQIHQVLVNLVVNAIQAMEGGGTLTIRTYHNESDIFLEVEDTGKGMSNDIMDQIFIPFFTTKDIGQGTGLGLSVVHGIVNSHGGDITVKSSLGQGSRFLIKLPARKINEESREATNGK